MLYPHTPLFNRLYEQIETMPVIDCHEHMIGPSEHPKYKEPIAALIQSYVLSDLQAAAWGIPEREVMRLTDPDVPTDAKWPLFEKLWSAIQHTAYAQVTKLVLQHVYGEEQMTRAALDRVAARLCEWDEAAYLRTIDQAGIQAMLVDVLGWLPGGLRTFLDGTRTFPDKWRPMISLPSFHPTTMTMQTIEHAGALSDRHITSLDEYVAAVYDILRACIARGAVGIKDQSAYERVIQYDLVTKADAERQFNQILIDPRVSLGWPEGKLLNDYLFHEFMRMARDLKMPVQLHTGHMAGINNRVDKTNASHLAATIELHSQVHFDLFHGNWPYMGDLLFLGKNYTNVSLDMCWLHIIDPLYASELLERAVMTIPQTKIHGFGGDYGDVPEYAAAHLRLARENIAGTLARLVERGWIDEKEAIELAAGWLFNNPNRFFQLGFEEIG